MRTVTVNAIVYAERLVSGKLRWGYVSSTGSKLLVSLTNQLHYALDEVARLQALVAPVTVTGDVLHAMGGML